MAGLATETGLVGMVREDRARKFAFTVTDLRTLFDIVGGDRLSRVRQPKITTIGREIKEVRDHLGGPALMTICDEEK